MSPPVQTLAIAEAAFREVDIVGVFRYANQCPHAIEQASTGNINIKCLITTCFPLLATKKALEELLQGKGIKTIITP
jgi:L-iditol 2-dehydrogenase